jgi:hypothetical protein
MTSCLPGYAYLKHGKYPVALAPRDFGIGCAYVSKCVIMGVQWYPGTRIFLGSWYPGIQYSGTRVQVHNVTK